MAQEKIEAHLELEKAHLDWLTEMVSEFSFNDQSNVVRVFLDYAIQDVDAADIFAPENMRCLHC